MKIIVVGATGTMGGPVAAVIAARGHEVVRASRHADERVDIEDSESIRDLYRRVGPVDGVVSCAGHGRFGPLADLDNDDFAFTLRSKLMGQVNLVRMGVDHLRDGGVFVLTAGIYGTRPEPGTPALAMANGALESFARATALDLPRGLRIVTISPPWLHESARAANRQGDISAADNARFYADVVDGDQTGQVIFPA